MAGKNESRGQSNWKIDSVGQRKCALLAKFTARKVVYVFRMVYTCKMSQDTNIGHKYISTEQKYKKESYTRE